MPPMSNLHPLAQAFSGEPLLIEPGKVDVVGSTIQYLSTDPEAVKMLNEGMSAPGADEFWGRDEHPYRPYVVHNGVLQIPIQGTLLNRFSYQFGRWATGYRYIEMALARGLADPQVKAIALIVDSPGGEVAGCFELGDKIFAGRDAKPIRAFASDHAYSAAYALASSASDFVVTRSGGTGSIGVVRAHIDQSEQLEKMGIKLTLIYAGKHKVDGNAYEKLPDSVKGRIQERIDRIYGVFTSTVARNRGIDDNAVRATEALTFDAQDSTAQGFADRIGALEEEMVIFTNEVAEAEDEQMSITQEQMDKAVAAAKVEGVAEGTAAGLEAGRVEGSTAERTRVTAIMGSDEAKNRPAAAQMMVDLGVPADKASEQLAKLPEEKASAPKGKEEAKGKKSGFEAAMENGNPEVGAEGGDEEKDKMSISDGIFASAGYAPAKVN